MKIHFKQEPKPISQQNKAKSLGSQNDVTLLIKKEPNTTLLDDENTAGSQLIPRLDQLQCQDCFLWFKNKTALANHNRKHLKDNSKSSLHLLTNVDEQSILPPKIDPQAGHLDTIFNDLLTNADEQSIILPKIEPQTEHSDTIFSDKLQCPDCPKNFKYKQALINHKRKHLQHLKAPRLNRIA
ncbi:unnamed protein product, partial [Meganyctiphanes norvegica]